VRHEEAAAITGAVRAGIRDCGWVHLACHAEYRPQFPSLSALQLYDGPLTVLEIADLRPQHADFVFLSACSTAASSASSADEVIHLASAMQHAGYRHVLATMWFVRDVSTRRMAREIYSVLIDEGGNPMADLSALALHRAVNGLRHRRPEDPFQWASYIHVGP